MVYQNEAPRKRTNLRQEYSNNWKQLRDSRFKLSNVFGHRKIKMESLITVLRTRKTKTKI